MTPDELTSATTKRQKEQVELPVRYAKAAGPLSARKLILTGRTGEGSATRATSAQRVPVLNAIGEAHT